MAESSKEKLERLCKSKDRGHRCVLEEKTEHTMHVCLCNHQWEEVKT